jgi:beta-phosphoglucomutase
MSIGIFFDLDGTLADSEPYHCRAWNAALRPLELSISRRWYFDHAIGVHDAEILPLLSTRFPRVRGTKSTLLKTKQKEFLRLVRQQSPIPAEVQSLITRMAYMPLAIVTSCRRQEVTAVLQSAGLDRYFRTAICLDDVSKPKPHPEPYLLAIEQLGVTAGIAFEDSIAGVTSAQSAGLDVVMVSHPRELPGAVASKLQSKVIF